jgi:predicted RNase H-like HicB family nuclease
MARFIALIDASDGVFGVAFPDAPGCTAMGETQQEAIDNATEALAEWVADELADGRAAPSPRSLDELGRLTEVSTALASGAVLAMIPLILDSGKVARANISIDTGLLADIDEAARLRGVTRSAFLAAAARDKIKAGA